MKSLKYTGLLLANLVLMTGLEAKIKIENNVQIFSEKTKDPQAITVSPNGDRVFWIARKSQKTKLEAIDAWYSDTQVVEEKKLDRPFLNIYTMASNIDENRVLIDHEYGGVVSLIKTLYAKFVLKSEEPKGYKSCIDLYNLPNKKVEKKLCPKDFGLKNELLAHARISPDLNWITFYIKGAKNPAGIYLYNLNTEKVFFLGENNDKHPTFSSDGKKIIFHFQKGGNVKDAEETEEAFIGWYDLEIDGNNLISAKRNLIDSPDKAKSYTYQKHPVLIPNTSFVIYHGQESAEGSKKLYVRKLEADSKVEEIQLKIGDCKVKSTKHPAIGFNDQTLYFIGKLECKDVKSEPKIFKVDTREILNALN